MLKIILSGNHRRGARAGVYIWRMNGLACRDAGEGHKLGANALSANKSAIEIAHAMRSYKGNIYSCRSASHAQIKISRQAKMIYVESGFRYLFEYAQADYERYTKGGSGETCD